MKQKLDRGSLVGYAVLDKGICVCAYCWNPDEWGGDIVEISQQFAPVAEMMYPDFGQWCWHCDIDAQYWGTLEQGDK